MRTIRVIRKTSVTTIVIIRMQSGFVAAGFVAHRTWMGQSSSNQDAAHSEREARHQIWREYIPDCGVCEKDGDKLLEDPKYRQREGGGQLHL